MAAKNNIDQTWHPEKVTIVAGPSFGNAVCFMLLGAAVGAAGALYWSSSQSTSTLTGDAVTGRAAKVEERAAQLMQRLQKLSRRVKNLASRARETAQHAAQVVGPAVGEAISEAKSVAQTTQRQIESDLHPEPSDPIVVAAGDVSKEQA